MNDNERKEIKRFVRGSVSETTEILKNISLWEGWENVADHCLIEAARVCVLADLLGFSRATKHNAVLASLLHDGHKRDEIEAIQQEMRRGGSGYRASNDTTDGYLRELTAKGVPEASTRFISIIGGRFEVLLGIKEILDKKILSEEDSASLVVHYVDDYTRGGSWVEAATAGASGRGAINDIDRRIEMNKNNPNYKKIDKEIQGLLSGTVFSGMTGFEAMAVISHEIEKRFSRMIEEKTGKRVDPLGIPEFVDKSLLKLVEKNTIAL